MDQPHLLEDGRLARLAGAEEKHLDLVAERGSVGFELSFDFEVACKSEPEGERRTAKANGEGERRTAKSFERWRTMANETIGSGEGDSERKQRVASKQGKVEQVGVEIDGKQRRNDSSKGNDGEVKRGGE